MTNPKLCLICGGRGKCTDSRLTNSHVRRRYHCLRNSKHRWTTLEIAVEKSRRYSVKQEELA